MNRIYARVHNAGPATAFDFDVRFRISEPYHTVGGEADFDKFVGIKHIASLAPRARPTSSSSGRRSRADQPHACVKVDLINLVGTDTNANDNWAQENLEIVATVAGSPYHPVTYSYNLTNPYTYPALFYFRHENAPPGWKVVLSPRKIRLNPGERMVGQATITPPEKAKVCTSERVQVTSWTPRGDTLINVGGGVVQVDLRRSTAIRTSRPRRADAKARTGKSCCAKPSDRASRSIRNARASAAGGWPSTAAWNRHSPTRRSFSNTWIRSGTSPIVP